MPNSSLGGKVFETTTKAMMRVRSIGTILNVDPITTWNLRVLIGFTNQLSISSYIYRPNCHHTKDTFTYFGSST
jgi:hypothetical protein